MKKTFCQNVFIKKMCVRIIATCNCKVVNHTKNAKQFFPQGKFNSSESYSSTLYQYFIHPLHAIISITIIYHQNYIVNCQKYFVILKKTFCLWWTKSFTVVCIFLAKKISKYNLNAAYIYIYNICIYIWYIYII